jgi:hypothetical protein
MKRPVLITTPIPSAEQVAKTLGMSKSRLRRLQQIVEGSWQLLDELTSSTRSANKASKLDGRHRDANGRISERHGDRKPGAA